MVSISDVLIFTPYKDRLEPETVAAVQALQWDGPLSWLLQRDNPVEGDDDSPRGRRATGVANHLHQYQRGREVFLAGRYDAMLTVEADIIPPPDALERLAALDVDVGYGVYMFRVHAFGRRPEPEVNLQANEKTENGYTGGSWSRYGLWPPKEPGPAEVDGAGFGCTLIHRRVLEAIQFRALNPALTPVVHCDSWFTADVGRAGFNMMADTGVLCGHKTPEGEVLWPPE